MSPHDGAMPRFATGGLVDHHCHGVVQRDLDRAGFESLLNEGAGPGPLGTTYFESMLGLAVRRWCAPVLGLDPFVPPDDYLDRRRELGFHAVNSRFVSEAGVTDFVVDTGFAPEPISSAEELARLGGGVSHEVVRLETVAQDLLGRREPLDTFPERLVEALTSSRAVAAKSIAAYRVGLRLPAAKPSDDALVSALRQARPLADGSFRVAHPVVNGYLAWTAVEQGLPLQFHVGYGDSDVDLRECDPLLLTGFLRATEDIGVPVTLLHNYPFHRHASYLAQVFAHVFMDVGLAVHNTGTLSRGVIRECLELVPFAKMLYSSDAFGLAELYYLGALLFRRGLSGTLDELVGDGEMTASDAERICRLVGGDNARRVYGLPAAP